MLISLAAQQLNRFTVKILMTSLNIQNLDISLLCRELSFWNPGAQGIIERSDRASDVKAPTARYPFEVTLHQGAIENIFLDAMSTRGLIVDRPTTVYNWQIFPASEVQDGYRIKVTLRHLMNDADTGKDQLQSNVNSSSTTDGQKEDSQETFIHAKYVIGCDGAHSWVRKKLGFTMDGEQTGKCLI